MNKLLPIGILAGLWIVLAALMHGTVFALNSPQEMQTPPCSGQWPTVTSPIAVPSSATRLLISGVTGQAIYVCGWALYNSGGTAQLKYGTGATCANSTNLTAALGSSTTPSQISTAHEVFKIPVGNNLCVTGGASAAGTGWITYVNGAAGPTPTASPSPTPTPSPTASPTPTPSPTASPT